MAENTPIIKLRNSEIRRVRNGHPWIYQKSIAESELPKGIKTGDQVTVHGPKNDLIGTALYSAESKIKLRVVSREIETIDQAFFEKRLKKARDYRNKMLPGRTSFRLVNSESDELSGLIIDCYESATLFQITSAGMECRKAAIIEAIKTVLKPDILVERNDVSNRKFEGLQQVKEIHQKNDESLDLENFKISIDGIEYNLNLIEGNKTGLYLDQIDNHALLRSTLSRYENAKVLDCFSYIGGFSLTAGKSNHVQQVIGIDQSAECIDKAESNAVLNGIDSKCSYEKANVFDWLRKASTDSELLESFDVIILDPPSFTKNRHTVDGAIRGYKELHVRALKLLKPGGSLLTYSCSHHINGDLLRSIVFEASRDTGSKLIEYQTFQQSLDHPIVPQIPESYYLKGFAYYKNQ